MDSPARAVAEVLKDVVLPSENKRCAWLLDFQTFVWRRKKGKLSFDWPRCRGDRRRDWEHIGTLKRNMHGQNYSFPHSTHRNLSWFQRRQGLSFQGRGLIIRSTQPCVLFSSGRTSLALWWRNLKREAAEIPRSLKSISWNVPRLNSFLFFFFPFLPFLRFSVLGSGSPKFEGSRACNRAAGAPRSTGSGLPFMEKRGLDE